MKLISKNKPSENRDENTAQEQAGRAVALAEKPSGVKRFAGRLFKTGKAEASGHRGGRKKKMPVKKKVIIAVCVIAVLAAALVGKNLLSSQSRVSMDASYTTASAQKRDLSVTLSGSGTLKAADSYEVTSLATGEILSDSFEEGDTVEEGTELYQIDPADAESTIKSAALNVEKSQLSYENTLKSVSNLSVTAPSAGTITELSVKVGDNVSNGSKIGTIRNSATMCLLLPFNSADVDAFYVGETADVTLDSTFETLIGTVTKISRTEQVLTGNMLVKYVTIEVSNPGGITDSTQASATIGGAACNSGASFTYKSTESITAKTSGEVSVIYADEGDAVSKGTVLLKLTSSDLEQSLKNAQLSLEDAQNSLENKQEALEDYTIKSPIAGTIIEKNYKAGDKLTSSSGQTVLCTIFDLSYLTMEISVDELDVSTVEVGQTVSITADAVEGKTYTGQVTKVNINGTTSNGVTAYPVTVKITDTDGLLPGMNVNAEIVVESATDVLCVPVDAVARGNMVLVKTGSGEIKAGEILEAGSDGLPEGFEYKQVTLGINNDEYIEISDGLSEGDTVAIVTLPTSNEEQAAGFVMGGGDMGGSGDMGGGGQMGGSGGPPSGGGGGGQMGG